MRIDFNIQTRKMGTNSIVTVPDNHDFGVFFPGKILSWFGFFAKDSKKKWHQPFFGTWKITFVWWRRYANERMPFDVGLCSKRMFVFTRRIKCNHFGCVVISFVVQLCWLLLFIPQHILEIGNRNNARKKRNQITVNFLSKTEKMYEIEPCTRSASAILIRQSSTVNH